LTVDQNCANLKSERSSKKTMKLYFDSKNPYRNLEKNLRRCVQNKKYDDAVLSILLDYAQTKCLTTHLHMHPSIKFFQVDVNSVPADQIDSGNYLLNPWEILRTEFVHAMNCSIKERNIYISKSIAWFLTVERVQDWIVD